MNKQQFDYIVQSAREANLADYFIKSNYSTKRFGNEIYVKEFPTLCINRNTNSWYYHYGGVGGNNSIDCLVKICGRTFNQAVYELTGKDISTMRSSEYPKIYAPLHTSPPQLAVEKPEKILQMPDRAENMRRVFAYFCKERKIPHAIVEELAHQKLLYQSAERINTSVNGIPQVSRPPNAVFVHRDESGNEIGGEIQGVNSYKRYKGIVTGTGDSVFMFAPCPASDGKTKTAYLFESAIDLMSFYVFCKPEKMQGVTLISMAGLKPNAPKIMQSQGVNVLSCVDNDDEGRRFESVNNFKRPESRLLKTAGVKDWNDLLKMKIAIPDKVKDFVPDIEPQKFIKRR
jgi:hypothetical protein